MSMKWNKTLALTSLAINASLMGKKSLATRLLALAAKQKDATAAVRILEASNLKARKLVASEEFPVDEEETGLMQEVEAEGVDELCQEVEAEGEAVEPEVAEDEAIAEEEKEITEAATVAKVLSVMRKYKK